MEEEYLDELNDDSSDQASDDNASSSSEPVEEGEGEGEGEGEVSDRYMEYIQNINDNKKKTILTGGARLSRPFLTKFELVMAVSRVAHQINNGAKIPKVTEGSVINYDTDVFFLALRSVLATVRRGISEPLKGPEEISKCASVLIYREVGKEYVEVWKLHELIWLEAVPSDSATAELLEEARSKYVVDPALL